MMTQNSSDHDEFISIGRATQNDVAEIARVFRESFQATLPFVPTLHSPEEDLNYFKEQVLTSNDVFVARSSDEKIVGFIAFNEAWVNHLYLLPSSTKKGIGKRLLDEAKRKSESLMLWAFQKNENARDFYMSQGFKIVKETDGSENEEKEPDILMEWTKS